MFVKNESNNLSFNSLVGLKYAKKNPRLAKVVMEIKNSKAFDKLFADPRFDCFIKLNTTKIMVCPDPLSTYTYIAPAERCEIDIVSKNGKGCFINNLKAGFSNFYDRLLASNIPTTSTFLNKFDEKNIGTILIQKDGLPKRISELKDDELVEMVDDMIAEREELMVGSMQYEEYVEEASKAAEELLKK